MQGLKNILSRLDSLESEKQISAVMLRYMRLCDGIGEGFPLDTLTALFTDDAIWEGVGALYQKKMGRHEGIVAIEAMFAKYTRPPAHFKFNLHIMSNQFIEVSGDLGEGEWVLLQQSDFTDGNSYLSGACIKASFLRLKGEWKIAHFQTRNLLSRPMSTPWAENSSLPVPE